MTWKELECELKNKSVFEELTKIILKDISWIDMLRIFSVDFQVAEILLHKLRTTIIQGMEYKMPVSLSLVF